MKTCFKCGLPKEDSEFHRFLRNKDGLQAHCKACRKAVDAGKYRRRTKDQNDLYLANEKRRRDSVTKKIFEYLLEHPCVDCGERDPLVLEFDHVRGDKIGDISGMAFKRSWEIIELEISKCEVRCANCHRRITRKRGNHRIYILAGQVLGPERSIGTGEALGGIPRTSTI